jgi:virginiamycin B lyase
MPRSTSFPVVVLSVALLLSTGIPHAGAQQSDLSEIPVPTAGALLQGIVQGPDGNLWFAERNANAIGRVTPSGVVTEFTLPNPGSAPFWLVVGPDGALWFTEISGNRIGRIAVDGSVTEFSVPTAASQPTGLAVGPDGDLWFTERNGNKIGRIDTTGSIDEFWLPRANSGPWGIAAGPDGALWFTEQSGNRIGRMDTSGALLAEYPLSPANRLPSAITSGPGGAVWFTERAGDTVGRITAAGAMTRFPLSAGANPVSLVTGSDGNVWFTELGGNAVGQITPDGVLTEFAVPTAASQPFGIATGPGGFWFTESAVDKVGRLEVVLDDTPPVVTVSSPLDGALVLQGSALVADYACADEDGGSGLASCDGSVPDGAPLDTAALGTHVLSVAASDNAGNTASASAGYMVVAGMSGKLAPLPAVTSVKAGSAVPVGVDLGTKGGRGSTGPWATSTPVRCADPSVALGPPENAGKVDVSNGGHVEVVWRTVAAWKGGCRELWLGFGATGWNTASAVFLVSFS